MAGTSITNKRIINIFGYPRSGTTFLKTVLTKLYPDIVFPLCRHTVWETNQDIKNGNIPIVPFRNPLDSIASWNIYRQEDHLAATHFNWHNDTLDADIRFYLRINSFMLENYENVLLMPFEKFVDDAYYIEKRTTDRFGIISLQQVDIENIKEEMRSGQGILNLPRETKPLIENIKPVILDHNLYSEAYSLYQDLLKVSEE